MLKTIFYPLAALVRKILFSPIEDESHITAPPCNILSLYLLNKIFCSFKLSLMVTYTICIFVARVSFII
jgi:hypothetical protein